MLRWRQIDEGFIAVDVGKAYNEKPFYWTTFYYYKGILVDTGCPHTAEESLSFLKRENLDIHAVLLTHFHEDHSGGASILQDNLNVEVFAPKKAIEILKIAPQIPLYRQTVWGQPKPVIARPLRENMKLNQMEITIIDTPGHSFDHASFLADDKLFIGDLVATPTPVIIMKQEDYIDLINSLRKVLEFTFTTACGGHGIWSRGLITQTLGTIQKLKREVESLHQQGLSSAQIVEELLSDVSQKVLSMEKLSEFEWSRQNLVDSLLGRMHEI